MRLLALVSLAALSISLVGCGGGSSALGDNGAEICFNTAVPFEYTRSTFEVKENLQRTTSWDFLQGIQGENAKLITVMEEKFQQFTGYTGTPSNIASIKNSLDTMEEVIANEEVGNIQDGRFQITQNIDTLNTCKYSNKFIVLRNEEDDRNVQLILVYNYSSSNSTVARTISEFEDVLDSKGNPVLDENGNKKTTVVATQLNGYNASSFSSNGHNSPLATFAQWINEQETLQINKDYQQQKDWAEYSNVTTFSIGGNDQVKRYKILIDYKSLKVDVFTSNFQSYEVICHPDTEDEIVLNDPSSQDLKDNNCENLDDHTVSYLDPGYDTINDTPPTPIESYTGTQVSTRQ